MTIDQLLVTGLLALLFVFFVWGRIRYDVAAIGGLVLAVALGLVPGDEAFSGFGHPAVITVAGVLIMSRALSLTGAVDGAARLLRKSTSSPTGQIGLLSSLAALMSGFMNNVGALAILMPATIDSCRKEGRSPRLVLMPLAFASILGGMFTLIGTPPNILIALIREEAVGEGFAMFDFAPVGAPIALVGIAFVALVGWRLIPKGPDKGSGQGMSFDLDEYLFELAVPKASEAYGKSLSEIEAITEEIEVAIVGLVRRKRHYPRPPQHEPLQGTDRLLVEGSPEELDKFVEALGLRIAGTNPGRESLLKGEGSVLAEAVVTPGSRYLGRTIQSLRLKGRYNLSLLGISRQGRARRGRLNNHKLESGDVLLVQGLESDVPDALSRLGCLPLAQRDISQGMRSHGLQTIVIFAGAILAAAFGLLPIAVAFVAAVLLVVVLGILPIRELYTHVDWPVIVLLAALLPIGGALETTGLTSVIAAGVTDLTAGAPIFITVALLLVVTMTLSDILNNAATVVVMAPIGLELFSFNRTHS